MHDSLFKGAFNNLRFQLEACMNINQLPKCFKKAKDSIKEHDHVSWMKLFLNLTEFLFTNAKTFKKMVVVGSLIFRKSCFLKSVTCISTLKSDEISRSQNFNSDFFCNVSLDKIFYA